MFGAIVLFHSLCNAASEGRRLSPSERDIVKLLDRLWRCRPGDARLFRRQPARRRATLVSHVGLIPVIVRNTSAKGFCVEAFGDVGIDPSSEVELLVHDLLGPRYAFPARLVWTTGQHAGLALTQNPRSLGPARQSTPIPHPEPPGVAATLDALLAKECR